MEQRIIRNKEHWVVDEDGNILGFDHGTRTQYLATVETNPLTGGIAKLSMGDMAVGLIQMYPSIVAIPGVIAFWDFTEPRAPFYSKAGRGAFPLRQGYGSRVKKGTGGPLGNSVVFNGSSDYLIIDAENVDDLNIGGRGINECFVLAFIKRADSASTSFIAGCWREDNASPRRQYGLFVDLPTYGGDNKVCFHVSKTGSASPGIDYSRDYSANGSGEPNREWCCVSGSYDGDYARSYIESRFEPYANYTEPSTPGIGDGRTYNKNPYAFADGLNSANCEFTVGACKLTSGYSNFFSGEIAALLVMDRAPSLTEIADIQSAINPATYGFKNRLFQWNTTNTAPNALYGCGAYRPTSDDSATLSSWQRATLGNPAQGFVYRPSSSIGVSMFTCESIPEGITTSNLDEIKFELANASTGDTLRLALKIDDAWYVTDATYAVSAPSASGSDWSAAEIKTVLFAKTAALWRDLSFVPGASLVAAGTVRGADLPDGEINGYGFYNPSTPAGNVRIRNVELLTY